MPISYSKGSKQKLESSDGLYNYAYDSGLQEQADDIIARNSGEKYKEIFSGGIISDIFDVLSMDSYGVVGLLKGKGFIEGIKSRESFSDKDSLGQYGWGGAVAGIVADIAVSPLTYISPWKTLSKVPGVVSVMKQAKSGIFGKMTETAIDGSRTYMKREGGLAPAKYLADKLVWMSGKDPVYRETYERMQRDQGLATIEMEDLTRPLALLEPKSAEKLLRRGDDLRFRRSTIDELQAELSAEDLAKVAPTWNKIDELGKEMVDLGILSKTKYEDSLGQYIKNIYSEYQSAQNKRFSFGTIGIGKQKGRVQDLTKEKMEELGQVDNPAVLAAVTLKSMYRDVIQGKFLKEIGDKFSTNEALPGFIKVPDTPRFQTSQGKIAESATKINSINEEIKPLLKELKKTFSADAKLSKEMKKLESQIEKTNASMAGELTKFFNYGERPANVTEKARSLGIIPDNLMPIANLAKKYPDYDTFIKSQDGIQLEKAYEFGELEAAGIRSMKDFFDRVKSPYKAPGTSKTARRGGITTDEYLSKPEYDVSVAFSKKGDIIRGIKREFTDTPPKSAKGATTREGIMENIQPKSPKVVLTEMKALAKRLQDFSRGATVGKAAAKREIKDVQKQVAKILEKNFDLNDRGSFLRTLRNTTDAKTLEKTVQKVIKEVTNVSERKLELAGMDSLRKTVTMKNQIMRMVEKSADLSDIDKRSINNSFINLENRLNSLRFGKEDLVEQIEINKMGQIAGKYVPEEFMDMIDEMVEPMSDDLGRVIMGEFKFMKVVMSPAAHVRNMLSNGILNYWKLGLGPKDFGLYAGSFREIFSKTPSEMVLRARKQGLGASNFASQELRMLLDDPSIAKTGMIRGKYERMKQVIGNIYQKEEDVAKLTAFKFGIRKGMSDEAAWKAAEEATFNYAQVTPFVRKMRTSLFGAPFITFALKAAPAAVETALKSPNRIAVFGKAKTAIENQGDQEEIASEKEQMPHWMKDGFYIKLPTKDEYGRSAYFDATYIMPFSSLVLGAADFAKIVTGTQVRGEDTVGQAAVASTPAFQFISEIARNRDFTGNKIVRETDPVDQQVMDYMEYLIKVFAPPPIAAQIPVGYNQTTGEPVGAGIYKSLSLGEEPRQNETPRQEVLSYIGMKYRPFDEEVQASINEWNKKQELEKLLIENQKLRRYSTVYEPKE